MNVLTLQPEGPLDAGPVEDGVTFTVPADVAASLVAAAEGQQVTALHFAGYYASLAENGRYTEAERVALRVCSAQQTTQAELLRAAIDSLTATRALGAVA